jgi:hypothetical protein
MALITAAGPAIAEASPQPLAPSGLVVQRVYIDTSSTGGTSVARGMA